MKKQQEIELHFMGTIGEYLLLASKANNKERNIFISEAIDILGGFPLDMESEIINNLYDYLKGI